MTQLELIQGIGNAVCEGCGPDADCREDPKECGRILEAVSLLHQFLDQDLEKEIEVGG